MSRRVAWCLVAVAALGCKRKPKTPEEQAAADLKQFFDGMLVTSDVKPPSEQIWPVHEGWRAVDWPLDLAKYRYDFPVETREELRAIVDVPLEKMTSRHLPLLEVLYDLPNTEKLVARLAREKIVPAVSVAALAETIGALRGPEAALKVLEELPSVPEKDPAAGRVESVRCFHSIRIRRYEDARRACERATRLDPNYGQRTLVYALIGLDKKEAALAQARSVAAMPDRANQTLTFLTLGVAQQYNGDQAAAMETWNAALARWPKDKLLLKAINTARRPVADWVSDEEAVYNPWRAKCSALCGDYYADLGMKDRSEACYAIAESFLPNTGLAHRLVELGQKDATTALEKATAAVRDSNNVELLSATAWLLLRVGKAAEARGYVERALAENPWDVKSMSVMWQVCGELKDYVCLIDYRKRLGLPTHFNVLQYRDAERAFEEQAKRNGVATSFVSVALHPTGLRSITVVPMGDRDVPEIEGTMDLIAAEFPGIPLTLADRAPLPQGAYSVARDQVIWEEVLARLPRERGRLYLIEQDLGARDAPFSFAQYDLERSIGVISLSRLRSLVGKPTAPDTVLDRVNRAGAKGRLRSQMVNGIGRLLGMSHPCTTSSCALRNRPSVADFTLENPPFCDRHVEQLAKIRAQMAGAGTP